MIKLSYFVHKLTELQCYNDLYLNISSSVSLYIVISINDHGILIRLELYNKFK